MPKFDTHLYNLIGQWFEAKTDAEQDRLSCEAKRHMLATGRATNEKSATNYWKMLIDLLEDV